MLRRLTPSFFVKPNQKSASVVGNHCSPGNAESAARICWLVIAFGRFPTFSKKAIACTSPAI